MSRQVCYYQRYVAKHSILSCPDYTTNIFDIELKKLQCIHNSLVCA